MKYLITGASGHLGQAVVSALRTRVADSSLRLGIHTLAKEKLFADTKCEMTHLDFQAPASVNHAVDGVDIIIYIPRPTQAAK